LLLPASAEKDVDSLPEQHHHHSKNNWSCYRDKSRIANIDMPQINRHGKGIVIVASNKQQQHQDDDDDSQEVPPSNNNIVVIWQAQRDHLEQRM
jgi:hypothetical protein